MMVVFLIQLSGAVALLLWSVRLIRSGMERAFMPQIRTALRRGTTRRAMAAVAGAGAAVLLQSSTAVAMLVAAFIAAATLQPAAGFALLLGADFGSALLVRVLLLPIGAAVPLLLLVGIALFFKGRNQAWKQAGRIVTGLGLVLVSLEMLRTATAPLSDNGLVTLVMSHFESDLISAFLVGAVLAWVLHSSVAAVLTYVTLVAEGLLPTGAAAAMVLGANLGGAVVPVVWTLSAAHPARLVVTANLAVRGGLAVLALCGLVIAAPDLTRLGPGPAAQVINLHLGFNLVVVLLALPVVPAILRLVARLLPVPAARGLEMPRSVLDEAALTEPHRALSCANREVLRMGERLNAMLVPVLGLFRTWDEEVVRSIAAAEDEIDRMHFDIKIYIARLQEGQLSSAQMRRAMDLATISNNLEEAADRVSAHLVDMAHRMHAEGLGFSEGGWRDLTGLHDQVLANTQLALTVLMSGDADAARQLVEEKDRMRRMEQQLQARHIERLRKRKPTSIETSNIHQETLRALKQINSAVSYVAYPIAEETGDLLASRLAGETMTGTHS